MKTIPAISVESQLLIKKLATIKEGEVISYEDMTDIIGRDARPSMDGYGSLCTARHRLERDEGIFFASVRNVGLQRCDDLGKLDISKAKTKQMHRKAKDGMRALAAVAEFDKLPNEKKLEHNTYMSLLGCISQATTERQIGKLTSKVLEAKDKLPLGKTLDALR